MTHRALPLVAALTVALLLGPGAFASPPPLGHRIPSTTFDTGRVNVVLPSPAPLVNLVEDANSSVAATLGIAALLEIQPPGPNAPNATSVAVAVPPLLGGFNETSLRSNATWPVRLTAGLPVVRTDTDLWNGSAGVSAPGPLRVTGSAVLTVEVDVGAAPGGQNGIALNWSIQHWPWQNLSDVLAVELELSVVGGRSLFACSVPVGASPAACAGEAIPVDRPVWQQSISTLEGASPSGPIAAVAWTGASGLGSEVGIFTPGNATGYLVIGGPLGTTAGSVEFGLVAPVVPPLERLVRGEAAPYFGALGTFAAAGLALVLYYRRRHRIEDEGA